MRARHNWCTLADIPNADDIANYIDSDFKIETAHPSNNQITTVFVFVS
jgi:hypothetical protein